MSKPKIHTVLFDLDGTLADTAPDLAFALNAVLLEEGRAALTYETIRPWVSHGGRYMIRQGFQQAAGHPAEDRLWRRLVSIYQQHIADQTRLFPGMDEVLEKIEQQGMKWGIVTNKAGQLTDALLTALKLRERSVCTVSGDTLTEKKPHPAPILHACAQAGCAPRECLYVGDAQRDIEAGQRAGAYTAAALFGYLGAADRPREWGADALLESPLDLLAWL